LDVKEYSREEGPTKYQQGSGPKDEPGRIHFGVHRVFGGSAHPTRMTNTANQETPLFTGAVRGPFQVRVVGLPSPAPGQGPQPARREDNGEDPGHAYRDQRPDEEEVSAGVTDGAGDADTLPPHVGEGDDQRKEPSKEGDDVPRPPFGQHQCSVQPDDKDGHRIEVCERSRLEPADDVVRQVKRKEKDREQRRDG
jgi:hypothetical protein